MCVPPIRKWRLGGSNGYYITRLRVRANSQRWVVLYSGSLGCLRDKLKWGERLYWRLALLGCRRAIKLKVLGLLGAKCSLSSIGWYWMNMNWESPSFSPIRGEVFIEASWAWSRDQLVVYPSYMTKECGHGRIWSPWIVRRVVFPFD